MFNFWDVIKNHYVDFAGKATRKQFWLYVLWYIIVSFGLGLVFSFFGSMRLTLCYLFVLAILLPSLAITARRLRDASFSPWWLLLLLLPYLGILSVLILCLMPSKK